MPTYKLTSWHGDVATFESPNITQAKRDGAFLLSAYGHPSGEIVARNGRTTDILDSDVLDASAEAARLDERFRDFVDEYHLKPGQNIGDYVIHGDAAYDHSIDGPYVDVWCEATNVMDDYDAGYLDFRIPVKHLYSNDLTWAGLKSMMTYTYDAALTDTYAENGFWEDGPKMDSLEERYRRKRSQMRSRAIMKKGKTGNGAGQVFRVKPLTLAEQLKVEPVGVSPKNGIESRISAELADAGYGLVDVMPVGTDPVTRADHYVVIGRSGGNGQYATWDAIDWTNHPRAADRKRGVTLNHGHYGLSAEKARADARQRVKVPSASEKQTTFEVAPPKNKRRQNVNRPADKGRPYSRETTVGKDGKKRPPVKTLHCTPRISDYKSPKSEDKGKNRNKGVRR